MITIVIKKTPTVRLFDRMPLPKSRFRSLHLTRRDLKVAKASPFNVRVNRIQ